MKLVVSQCTLSSFSPYDMFKKASISRRKTTFTQGQSTLNKLNESNNSIPIRKRTKKQYDSDKYNES